MKKRLMLIPLLALVLVGCNKGGKESSSTDAPSNTPTSSEVSSTNTNSSSSSNSSLGTSQNSEDSSESSSQVTLDSLQSVLEAGIALGSGETSEKQYTYQGTVTNIIGNSFYIQDGDYASYVYNKKIDGLAIGDVVRVVSKITNFYGLVENDSKDTSSTATKVSTGTPITPTEVTDFSTLTQKDQSKLITIKGLAYVDGKVTVNTSGGIQFKQGEKEIEVRTDKSLDDTVEQAIADKINSLTVVDTVDLTGVNASWNIKEGVGKAQISLSRADSITINKGTPIPVTSVTAESNVTVEVGKTVNLNVKVEPENATNKEVEYEIADSQYVSVTDGVARGIKEGSTTITVKSKADSTKSCVVNVTVTAASGDVQELTASYSFECERSGSAVTDASKVLAAIKTESADKPTSASDMTNFYFGFNGGTKETAFTTGDTFKLGKSGNGGKITLTFDTSISIKKVNVKMLCWKSGVKLKINDSEEKTTTTFVGTLLAQSQPENIEFDLGSNITNSLTFSATERVVLWGFDITYTK